jgi:hypothetical protein
MRKIHLIVFSIVIFPLLLVSCKKELTPKVSGASSLTIVNGVVGNSYLYTNFNGDKSNGEYYSGIGAVDYGFSGFYNSYYGEQKLGLYQLPDTNADSKPVLRLTLNLPVNTIHTLFVMGTPQNADYLVTNDQLPYHAPADSTMGLRFVNIAPVTGPVTVNLAGQANGSEVADLAYKGVTPFKNYNAGSAVNSYTFEFRDKASGTLLGSCVVDGVNVDGSAGVPNIRRNKNYTLVLLGGPGGQAPNSVLIVDEDVHY